MEFLHIVMFCCFSVVCLKASEVQLSGHVGGDISIHCSGNWTTDNSSEHNNTFFCRGLCSRENILIQADRRRSGVTRRGRYNMEVNRGDGNFTVTIQRLKRTDAGRYICGVEKTFNFLYQEVSLGVLNAPTVPPGSPLHTSILQTETETLLQGSFPSTTGPSTATLTVPATDNANQQANNLTDTTLVIIVSVSLALLVCAIIPLIFYGHWRSNAGRNTPEPNKCEAGYCAGNAGVASTPLQCLEPDAVPESGAEDAS
ncbi:CMRF35-like molecule 5 isoform X2 [Mastacembelus armatus]|uniref:CMRF35-like molecule 5 isoform X2 n=1 Tax=Mastacembelus armatus TaxID=205130 RepID=UPI000E45B270|nr:CMRF35-like molecule 5 isoform X2 [Mastacembelus armatus]